MKTIQDDHCFRILSALETLDTEDPEHVDEAVRDCIEWATEGHALSQQRAASRDGWAVRLFGKKRRAPAEQPMYTEAQVRERIADTQRDGIEAIDKAVRFVAPDRYDAFRDRLDFLLHQAGARTRADRLKVQADAAKALADGAAG